MFQEFGTGHSPNSKEWPGWLSRNSSGPFADVKAQTFPCNSHISRYDVMMRINGFADHVGHECANTTGSTRYGSKGRFIRTGLVVPVESPDRKLFACFLLESRRYDRTGCW